MLHLFLCVRQDKERVFKSNQGEDIVAVEVHLNDGLNSVVATAFDKTAQRLIKEPLCEGALVNADITLYESTVKSDKGEFAKNNVRLNNYAVFGKAE